MKKLKKIPKFKNEDEERQFWAKHSPLDYEHGPILRGNLFPNLKPTTVMTSLRLPEWMLERIKQLANKRDIPAQSLMKMYLAEKLEEELRLSSNRRKKQHENLRKAG